MVATNHYDLDIDTTLGGSNASDYVIPSQKAIKTYVDNNSGGGGSVSIDNTTITENSSDELQTVGVIDQNNTSTAIKTWTGTKAQYDAIATKDTNTLYNITDDDTSIGSIVTDLNNKADTDLTNCSVPVVVSRTPNNQGGVVEIWNDGYCVQTGVISSETTTLSQPYKDTSYSIFLGFVAGTDGCWYSENKTTSSFQQYIKYYGANPKVDTMANYWRTEGYIR